MKDITDYIECKDFEKDVLSVKSPRRRVQGPYKVVKADRNKNYAIVTLIWDNRHTLGIRWFDSYPGMPVSHGYRTWFIIPGELWEAMISTMEPDIQKEVRDFLGIN